jgi:nucleotide-binding universal stress UspA family protein
VLTVHADGVPPRALRRLLVACDFSSETIRALELARGWVEPGGELIAAHVIPVVWAPGEPPEPLPDPVSEPAARNEYQKLAPLLAGVTARLEIGRGAPDVALLEMAERLAADAIVIGTRGRSGLAHVLLGSVAERVLRRSRLPVFTTRARAE